MQGARGAACAGRWPCCAAPGVIERGDSVVSPGGVLGDGATRADSWALRPTKDRGAIASTCARTRYARQMPQASALHALNLKQQQRLPLHGRFLVADREAEDAALFVGLFIAFKTGYDNDIPRPCA